MHLNSTRYHSLFFISFLWLFALPLKAQNIVLSYTNPDPIFVCNADTFFVHIQNSGVEPINNAVLSLDIPPGLAYEPGSIGGGAIQQGGTLNFSLPTLLPGMSQTFPLILRAGCEAADVLDNNGVFQVGIAVQAGAQSAQLQTNGMFIETGLLLIESVTPALLVGEKYDTLYREICLKNTRIGSIGLVSITDVHPLGFSTEILDNPVQPVNTPTSSSAFFDGALFSQFGDGDNLLELNETVCFTERVIIDDCGGPNVVLKSGIRAGWGCSQSNLCRFFSLEADVKVLPSTRVPDLQVRPVWKPLRDNCGELGAQMGLWFINSGLAEATNIVISLDQEVGADVAINPNTLRIHHNGTVTPIAAANFKTRILETCGKTFADSVQLVIPSVAAGDSVYLEFDVLACVSTCEQAIHFTGVNYFYSHPCAAAGVAKSVFIEAPEGYGITGNIDYSLGVCLKKDDVLNVGYTGISKRLLEADGYWTVDITLPPGFSLKPDCPFDLDGQPPISQQTTTSGDGSAITRFIWSLPLPNDTVRGKFCLIFDCENLTQCSPSPTLGSSLVYALPLTCVPPCFAQWGCITYWSAEPMTPNSCAISDCDVMTLILEPDPNCVFDIDADPGLGGNCAPGSVPQDFFSGKISAYRLNFDYADTDDDRNADTPLSEANGSLLRRDRYLPGDTLRVEYAGRLSSGGGYTFFDRQYFQEIIKTDLGSAALGGDNFDVAAAVGLFSNSKFFQMLRDSFRIRYADGTVVSCPVALDTTNKDKKYFRIVPPNVHPIVPIDEISSQNHTIRINFQDLFDQGCLPKPTFDLGDSIYFYTDYKIDLNFTPTSTNNPDPPLINFRTAVTHCRFPFAWNFFPYTRSQYSGFEERISKNTFGIRTCNNSTEIKKMRYAIRIARENMFPYEVRPLVKLQHYDITLPPGVEPLAAALEYLALQDTVPIPSLNGFALPFSFDSVLHVDFTFALNKLYDEGFMCRTNILFKPSCLFTESVPSLQTLYRDPLLHGSFSDSLITTGNVIGFFANVPEIVALNPDSLILTPQRTFSLDLNLKNLRITAAQSPWVYVVSPSGQITDINLFRIPQNQPLTSLNGVYNLPQLPGFETLNLRVEGRNRSCESDSILIIFGYGCAPIPGPAFGLCGRDTVVVYLLQESPELELDTKNEPLPLPLCTPSDYFEFEIYNGKTGYAYDLKSTLQLPAGLNIVPNSCEIAWPSTSAWSPLADPVAQGGGVVAWDFNTVFPNTLGANGLPGDNAPNSANRIRIRFKLLADCGFVANVPILYGVSGTEPCGRPSNMLNKPGLPLLAQGQSTPYKTTMSFQPVGNPNAGCGGEQTFQLSLFFDAAPGATDSVYVNLPPGVHLVVGSYLPGTNAPAQPTLTPGGFALVLPGNIPPAGGTMNFRFSIQIEPWATCQVAQMTAQALIRSSGFCASTGMNCDLYVASGNAFQNLTVQHPQLTLSNTAWNVTPNGLVTMLTLQNSGAVNANMGQIEIWQDVDGSQTLSTGDVLLQNVLYSTAIAPGGTLTLPVLLNLDPSVLCQLLWVLPSTPNCLCDSLIIPVNGGEILHPTMPVCVIGATNVGVTATQGFNYQWQSASGGFACPTCATTTFTPPPNTQPGAVFTLLLKAENGEGCTVSHRFELEFSPTISVAVSDPEICEGKTATLTPSVLGAAYQWQGPGIQNAGAAIQVVKPAQTSIYTLNATLSNGCTATAMVQVNVLPSDTLDLAPVVACEGDTVQVLNMMVSSAGNYQQLLVKQNGCDSLRRQSLQLLTAPKTTENRLFCQGDTLFLQDTFLIAPGQVIAQYQAANGCDSTHTVNVDFYGSNNPTPLDTIKTTAGTPITLNGPTGYTTYMWTPAPALCATCPSIEVNFETAGYYEYILALTDANGCGYSLTYRVLASPPCDLKKVLFPNAFTPNGDGNNDTFTGISPEGLEQISSVTIYNRWGEKVYVGPAWDGTIDGKSAPADVYVFKIDVRCSEQTESVWGEVTLVR